MGTGGLPGLAAVAHELGYGVNPGGGHPPVPPPVRSVGEEALSPKTKRLKGNARIKHMVKSSMWDWKGSSLDPVFRRPRIGLKRKREESESSDSSAKTVSEGLSDQEDLFPEEAQSRHISRKCPGLLARHAIREARKRVLADLGEESAHQTPRPVFVRYFRQVFDHSGASTPMKREYLTLAHCLDSLLEGNVLKCLDIAVQRLKAVEQISQGVHPGTANRMEIIPAEGFSLASAEENGRWLRKTGKGGGKPIAEDAGVKGEKGARSLTDTVDPPVQLQFVFPLPMPAVDESACEHAWAEAAVSGLACAQQRIHMDPEAEQRCKDKLKQAGLWGESLATLELGAAEGVAQQLVNELGLTLYDDVVFWVSQRIEDAKMQAPLLSRAQGLHGPSFVQLRINTFWGTRVVESAFGSTEFVNSVEQIGDVLVQGLNALKLGAEQVQLEPGVEIENPLTSNAEDYG
ncbi:unnamed protein product, partial [Symbiodinium sp. KB8]